MQRKTLVRVDRAARALLQGHSATAVVALLTEEEGLSRRSAQRITRLAYEQITGDLEAVGVDRRQLTAQVTHLLMEGMRSALASGHASAVAGCAKTLMELIGLGQQHRHP